MGEPVRTTDVRRQFQLGDTVFAVLMLIAAVLLIVTLLGSRLVSEARELTCCRSPGPRPHGWRC